MTCSSPRLLGQGKMKNISDIPDTSLIRILFFQLFLVIFTTLLVGYVDRLYELDIASKNLPLANFLGGVCCLVIVKKKILIYRFQSLN